MLKDSNVIYKASKHNLYNPNYSYTVHIYVSFKECKDCWRSKLPIHGPEVELGMGRVLISHE